MFVGDAMGDLVGPATRDERTYAGFWSRVAASLLDGLLLMVVRTLLLLPLVTLTLIDDVEPLSGIAFVIFLTNVAMVLYSPVMHSSALQATLGKYAIGIEVIDREGQRISFWRALLRAAALFLSCLTVVGLLMIGWTRQKRGLHDIIAGTFVVVRSSSTR